MNFNSLLPTHKHILPLLCFILLLCAIYHTKYGQECLSMLITASKPVPKIISSTYLILGEYKYEVDVSAKTGYAVISDKEAVKTHAQSKNEEHSSHTQKSN